MSDNAEPTLARCTSPLQPDDTLRPIVSGSLVPWIRKSVSLLPCQRYKARAPSGLLGPPGTPSPLCRVLTWRMEGSGRAIRYGIDGPARHDGGLRFTGEIF